MYQVNFTSFYFCLKNKTYKKYIHETQKIITISTSKQVGLLINYLKVKIHFIFPVHLHNNQWESHVTELSNTEQARVDVGGRDGGQRQGSCDWQRGSLD